MQQMNIDIFSNQILLDLIDYVLVYSNQNVNSKRLKTPKGIIKDYNVIINGKNVYDQPIDSDIKQYEEIGKLTTVQAEDYTTGCLLDYDYIKNHYRLIAFDLSGQKELDAAPKAIQQIEFVGQLKKLDNDRNATDACNDQSMVVLTILEKIKKTRLKFCQGNVTVL